MGFLLLRSFILTPLAGQAAIRTRIPSENNTTITAGTRDALVDSEGNIWRINKRGIVFKNGRKAGYSANVILLVWSENTIWQQNADLLWWKWNGKG